VTPDARIAAAALAREAQAFGGSPSSLLRRRRSSE
jgi:hypothetical protein